MTDKNSEFVFVPRRATKAMLDAAYAAYDAFEASNEPCGWGGLGSVYQAMIAAAPTDTSPAALRASAARLSASIDITDRAQQMAERLRRDYGHDIRGTAAQGWLERCLSEIAAEAVAAAKAPGGQAE